MFLLVVLATLGLCMEVHGDLVDGINVIDMKLRAGLLARASTESVPLFEKSKPINVTLGIEMKKIVEVNEVEQKFKIQVLLRMSWINEFIRWHPDEWGNISWIKVKPHDLWTPDIVPYNEMNDDNADVADKYKKLILVEHTGLNTWNIPVLYTLACGIEVEYFPFDVQLCPITFGSWEYNSKSLVLTQDASQIITSDYNFVRMGYIVR